MAAAAGGKTIGRAEDEANEEYGEHNEEDDDGVMCVVCCDTIEFFAVGRCDHAVCCSTCTLRMRELAMELAITGVEARPIEEIEEQWEYGDR